jgi:hypothetical protein
LRIADDLAPHSVRLDTLVNKLAFSFEPATPVQTGANRIFFRPLAGFL